MILGVVGHAAEKFTARTEALARQAIREVVVDLASRIVSGHCHMGGVDIWAEEIADELGIPKSIHAPASLSWGAPGGFKDRNLRIARESDAVLVVVVKELPPSYNGMRFEDCYHCKGRNPPHVKSGGCWTAWQAGKRLWKIISAT